MDTRIVYFLFISTNGDADAVARDVAMLDGVRWAAELRDLPGINVLAATVLDSPDELNNLKITIGHMPLTTVKSGEVPNGDHYTGGIHPDPLNGWP